MAKENNEIGDIVKKCKILLLDIEGTTTSISFVKDKLFPYAEENVKGFLESHWDSEEVKEAVAALHKQATEDQEKNVEGLVAVPSKDASKDEQIDGLVKNVKWQIWADRKVGSLKQLQGLIWKLGYDKGDIKGHVYDDVLPALELWRATEGQKVYIYSSGSVQAQKLLFSKSIAGDMLPLIEGHFDTAVGAKQEPASYAVIVEKIGCKAEEILFLTDIVKEAEAARASGLQAALVSREGNAPLPGAPGFPVLHSFEQLTHTNKRKPDPQAEEEVPAKVPKTDTQDVVKITSETEAGTAKANGTAETAAMETAAVVEKSKDLETMEVDESPDSVLETKEAEIKAVVETATTDIADITEKDVPMDEAVTVPVVAKPIVPVKTMAKAHSTDNAEAKIDTTDNASNAPAKQASAFEVMDVKAPSEENTKTNSVEPKVEVPKVEQSKVDEALAKTKDETEAKVTMVDATTLTDPNAVLSNKISKAVQTPTLEVLANEPAAVDAVIEPAALEVPAAKTPIEEPKKAETPVVETTAEVAPVAKPIVEMSAKGAIVAAAAETKDEANKVPASSTQNVEATSTADVVESSKMEAVTADSTTVDSPTTDVKTEESSTSESQYVKVYTEETSEASPKEAKSTEANATLESNGSGSSEAAEAPSEGVSIIVETDPLQNGVEKAADKPEEMDVTNQKDSNAVPEREMQLVVEEIAEKTEPKETEQMETEVTEIEEKVETAMEPKEPAKIIPKEPAEETLKEHAEKPPKETTTTTKEANLSTIEIKDITDDKESLNEVTDIIDDVVPIVEEPSHLEEMEELQNAGDVLEKECDEILSKVQDVTNLDYMPVKTLHTISEEMETDNTDTNDIVERILNTEMELSIKPEDIDLNTVQEIAEPITDTDERIGQIKPGTVKPSETKVEDVTEKKMEVSVDTEMVDEKPNNNKVVPDIENGAGKEATVEPTVEKMETEEVEPEVKIESEKKVAEESAKPQEIKSDTEVSIAVEAPVKTDEIEAKPENNESGKASVAVVQELKETSGSQDTKMDTATETKVNGNSNGNVVKLNGNASKDDDLKLRLTAETVKEQMNGSNGDSVDAEMGQGDIKVDAEINDIKVKTVTDEAHTPKEQPVKA